MGKRSIKGKRVLLLIISLLTGLICAGCGTGKQTVSGYTDAKNGVAVVSEYVAIDGEEVGLAYGSGFFVGDGTEEPQYLITNHHVIADYIYFGAGQSTVYTDPDGYDHSLKSYLRVYFDEEQYKEAYIVDYNEVADVAVLRLESPTDQRRALPICVPDGDMAGTQVYAIGFPAISDNAAVDSITSWGLDDVTFTSGIISRLTTTSGTGVQSIQIDVSIGHGNSGGPLVNEKGEVIGITTWGYTNYDAEASYSGDNEEAVTLMVNTEEASYAVNISEAVALLNRHNISYAAGAGQRQNVTAAAGAAIGIALIVIVLIVIVVLVSKKNKKSTSAKMEQSGISQQSAPTFPSTAPAASADTKQKQGSSDDTGYRLQGVSGALAGRRFMIRKGSPLIMGRNPDACNIVYPAGTAGVSGKHCQVWYDNGNIYLKDIGSSHGTFIASGAKLSVGQPMMLKAGESFSLGSEDETMVLAQKGGN